MVFPNVSNYPVEIKIENTDDLKTTVNDRKIDINYPPTNHRLHTSASAVFIPFMPLRRGWDILSILTYPGLETPRYDFGRAYGTSVLTYDFMVPLLDICDSEQSVGGFSIRPSTPCQSIDISAPKAEGIGKWYNCDQSYFANSYNKDFLGHKFFPELIHDYIPLLARKLVC
ncbi:hypothetical protein [Algoriphagus jejuensis]|uniref:hypothetical protein n=1 Tax=Algoriphagus jejuensis TaxID=419934 RepID=UPI0031D36CDB